MSRKKLQGDPDQAKALLDRMKSVAGYDDGQLANDLGISADTLRVWASRGRVPEPHVKGFADRHGLSTDLLWQGVTSLQVTKTDAPSDFATRRIPKSGNLPDFPAAEPPPPLDAALLNACYVAVEDAAAGLGGSEVSAKADVLVALYEDARIKGFRHPDAVKLAQMIGRLKP